MTVQAAISACSMLALAKAQAERYALPQNVLVHVPVDMRKQVWQTFIHQFDKGLGWN